MNPKDLIILPVQKTGRVTLSFINEMGKIGVFLFIAAANIFYFPLQIRKSIDQIYFIGVKSMLVICLTGMFTGMVLGIQGHYTLVKYGSQGMLGAAVALSLIRELGPVLTAIMVTARAGSAIAAEIGIMRISEQIDALKTMDINPIRFLVSPRLAAGLICFPLLTAIFDVIGILGGFFTVSVLLQSDNSVYFMRVAENVSMVDITGGFIKSIVFAIVVITICCFQGYYTHIRGFGAKGVGISTTSAVVISCVLIFVTDYILTSFLL